MSKNEIYFTDNKEDNQIKKIEYIKNQKEKLSRNIQFLKESIKDSDIESILLKRDMVVANFRRPKLSLLFNLEDERSCAIETINFSRYEPNDSSLIFGTLAYLSEQNPKLTFFDIGANEGFYSISSLIEFNNIDLHIFEAAPATAELLNKNLDLNKLKVENFNKIALSDKNGFEKFFYVPGFSGSSSFKNLVKHESAIEIEVPTKTLNTYILEKNIIPHFLKIDVEGAEQKVIHGFRETLETLEKKPILFIEILRKWSKKFGIDASKFFNEVINYGYACYSSCPENILKECYEINDETLETNFLFMPKEFCDINILKQKITEWKGK